MRSMTATLMTLVVLGSVSPAMADPRPSEAPPTQSESASPTASDSTSPSPSTSSSPSPSASPSDTVLGPYGIPMGQNIREDSWCRILTPNRKGDAAEADSIMQRNVIDLGQYGTYRLSANPNWKPQSSLDSSGNTHINGLTWAVPLLYTGARRGDEEMVQRFFDLIGDWLKDHRKKKMRTWSVTQPIIAGERLWTLTCAADISQGARFAKAVRKEADTQISTFRISNGTNNTGLHSQGSALGAFCYLDDPEGRDRAASNLQRLADHLVLADGSDREGSPWYAYYTLRLMAQAKPLYDRCGVSFDAQAAAMQRLDAFLAAAVDPNFDLVMTGDTMRAQLAPKWFAPGSVARWAATKGQEGDPPGKLFTTYSGGYVFGRNSWTNVDGHRPTFFSVRSARPYVTAHVHNDLGSVTYNSYGAEFIGDPGPYRYDNSAIRDYMVSRSGHSAIRITTLKPKKPKKPASASQAARSAIAARKRSAPEGTDQTCVVDRTYVAARISRCVYYDTGIDALVVVDSVKARKRIRADQRWQVAPGVAVSADATGATLTGKTAAARMVFSGGGSVRTYRPTTTRPDGWFSVGYGELAKGTVLQRGEVLPKGATREWVSVLAAGEKAPDVRLAEDTATVTRSGAATQFVIP